MADYTTTKIFADGAPVAAADLNAIVTGLTQTATGINSKTLVGLVSDTDNFPMATAGNSLQRTTGLQLKNYISPAAGASAGTASSTVTVAAIVPPPGLGTYLLAQVTVNVLVGKKVAFICTSTWAGAALTGGIMAVYRGDGTLCGQFPFHQAAVNLSLFQSFVTFDATGTPNGSTNYQLLASSTGGNGTVTNVGFLAVIF